MNQTLILLFLLLCLGVLFCLVLYQQFADRTGTRARLREISEKLERIIDTDSDERIMVFTENRELMELAAQMNCLLENHQKMKADSRRAQAAAKKMLANISHDLKTPMTVILGYLEIMQLDGAVTDEMLKKIQQKAQNVMELMNHFFTLAKLESGDKNIEMVQVNINELCRENVLGYYELLVQKDYAVDIIIPEQHIFVQGDRESVSRILGNLLSNAIRYGSDGKYIGLFLREELDFVCIDVVDKGKGIEKQFAASVFERLYTMEDSRNRSIQGNGLGLTIARNLARQMGGDILLQSEPGVRTVFTVKLRRWGDC